MKNRVFVVLCLLQCHTPFMAAQGQTLAQLISQLAGAKTDSEKANELYSISRLYWDKNADSVVTIADRAEKMADEAKYERGMALALLSKGIGYDLMAKFPTSLNCYLKALRIAEKLNLETIKAYLYEDIGIIYAEMSDYSRSLHYFSKSLDISRQKGNKHIEATLMLNMAEVYKKHGALDSALAFNNRALPMMIELHDSSSVATILLDIGDDCRRMKKSDEALGYLRRCAFIANRIHDEQNIAWSKLFEAEVYQGSRNYVNSIRQAKTALQIGRLGAFASLTKECYEVLYFDYKALSNFERALYYRNLEVESQDSIFKSEKDKKISSLQTEYELEKKQHQIDLLEKEKVMQQREIANQHQKSILLSATAIFFGTWAFFLFRTQKEKSRGKGGGRRQLRENQTV